ncbi:MAG: DUF2188 domain-containing protein [Ignavibacteria bacterium]
MQTQKNQHVVPYHGRWAVKGEGNTRYTAVVKEKYDAVRIARRISKNQRSELFIHNINGKISRRDSHGKDIFPPRG